MESIVMLKDFRANNFTEEEITSLYSIYSSKKVSSILKMIKVDREHLNKIKFSVLLFALIWEEANLIKSLYKVFSKDYEINIGFNSQEIIKQFYSNKNRKIYEIVFLECMNNQEYELIKEIYCSNLNFIAFTEDFLLENLTKIPYNYLHELITLQVKFFANPCSLFKNKWSKCLELNNIELLKLLCKAKFPEIFLYKFGIIHCTIHQAISVFIIEKKNRLAQILINSFAQDLINKFGLYFKIAAKFQNYKFIINNIRKMFSAQPYDSNIMKMISYLINNLKKSNEFIDMSIYIFTIKFSKLNYSSSDELLQTLQNKIFSKDKNCNLLLFVANPIKTLLMVFNLIILIKGKYFSLTGISDEFLKVIKDSILKISEHIHDFSEMVSIFDDKLFSGEKTIDLICKFRLYELMKNPLFHLYIHKEWDCSYRNSISLFDISSGWKIFSNEFISNPIKDWNSYIHIPNKYLKGSFIDYVRNPISKYYYKLFFDFIIIVILFILVFQFNSVLTYVLSSATSASKYEFYRFVEILIALYNDYFHFLDRISAISLIFVLALFGLILFYCFIFITKISYPLINFKLVFNLAIIIISFLLFDQIFTFQQEYYLLSKNFLYDRESYNSIVKVFYKLLSSNIFLYFSISFGLSIFKILFDIKLIQMFGSLITTIEIVFRKVIKFFLLYFIILSTFATIGSILFNLFNQIDDFDSMGSSFITLIGYSFGGFATSNYKYLKENESNAYLKIIIFCFLFMFVFNLIFINLLIGMIGSIYSLTTENRKEMYLIQIYQESRIFSLSKKYSSLNTSYNLIIGATIPLYLGYIFMPSEKINLLILAIQYTFILVLNIGIVLVYNLILSPFAYLFGIIKYKIYLITIDKFNRNNFIFYISYLVCGLPLLILSSFINAFQAAKLLLNINFNKSKYDHVLIIPKRQSFHLFIRELKHFSDELQSKKIQNDLKSKMNIRNLRIARSLGILNQSNLFSNTDIVSFFKIIGYCKLKIEGFLPDNLLNTIKSQKAYYKSWYCNERICQILRKEKWEREFIFLAHRIKFKFSVSGIKQQI